MEALVSDDQWAEAVLAQPPSSKPPARRMAEWSPELEMLTNLYDRMGELIRAVIASAGGKPGKVPPAPRPMTALERVRQRQARTKHERLAARMLPHRASGTPPQATAVPPPQASVRSPSPAGPGTLWLRRQVAQAGLR